MRTSLYWDGPVVSIMAILFLSGCASAVKERCKEESWTSYGEAKGKTGTAYEADPYLEQCRREGVSPDIEQIRSGFSQGIKDYCVADLFYRAARRGDAKNLDICPRDLHPKLKAKVELGLKAHCTKQGAMKRGKSGEPNLNLCPRNIQTSYANFYSRGRIIYLRRKIAGNQKHLAALGQRIVELERQEPVLAKKKLQAEEEETGRTGLALASVFLNAATRSSPSDIQQMIENNAKEKEELLSQKTEALLIFSTLQAELAEAEAGAIETETGGLVGEAVE